MATETLSPAKGKLQSTGNFRIYGVSKSDIRVMTDLLKPEGKPGVFAWRCNCLLKSMCNKARFLITAALNIFFAGLMARLLHSLNKRAPVGYQDESGFHFGVRKS